MTDQPIHPDLVKGNPMSTDTPPRNTQTPANRLPAVRVDHPLNVCRDDGGLGGCWHTLSMTDPKHCELIQTLGIAEGTTIDAWIGKIFVAEHMLTHGWERTDADTGETFSGIRVNLIDSQGCVLSFAGSGALRCLQRIMSIPAVGTPPWLSGLPLAVGQVAVGNGRRMHTLHVPGVELARMIEQHAAAKEVGF